jgi:ABC-type transport system involved in multi-copper enzyme maturation permease subunit
MKFHAAQWAQSIGEANPVLKREITARWRTPKAFFVVFSYGVVLAALAYFNYQQTAVNYNLFDTNLSFTQLPGRRLFFLFNQWQMGAWLVVAPLLTAGSIVGERERGLLESLILAPLHPLEIVWGKWFSAMALAVLLLLVPLPVAAICFQLGGLAPNEFFAASLLQFTTAALGAAVGLWHSARAPRLNDAISRSLWAMLSFGWIGPVLFFPRVMQADAVGACWIIVFLSFTISLVNSAARLLLVPQEEMHPEVQRTWMDERGPMPMTLDIGIGDVQSVSRDDLYGKAPDDPERFKRWDMPGAELLRFENPVLQREVRTHLRLRAQNAGAKPGENGGCALVFLFLTFGLYGLLVFFAPEAQVFFWGVFSYLWMLCAAFAAAYLGSSAFTRERAAGMMEFLMLTCLKPHEILWGKVAGAGTVIAYYSLALVPALLPCVLPALFKVDGGLSGQQIFATLTLIGATTLAAASWGALVSWLCRQNFVASAVALIGILLFRYVPLMNWLDPLAALVKIRPFDYSRYRAAVGGSVPLEVWLVSLSLLLFGALCAALTLRLMLRDPLRK